MATLSELLLYLEQGAVLRSTRGESLRLIAPGKVEWVKAKGYYFEDEVVTLAEVRNYKDVWDWRVVAASPPKEQ